MGLVPSAASWREIFMMFLVALSSRCQYFLCGLSWKSQRRMPEIKTGFLNAAPLFRVL